MKAIYGKAWMDDITDKEDLLLRQHEWREALKSFSYKHVKEAINYCRDYLAKPPAIATFRRIVREHERKTNFLEAPIKEAPTDEQKKIHKKTIAKLAEMSRILAERKRDRNV